MNYVEHIILIIRTKLDNPNILAFSGSDGKVYGVRKEDLSFQPGLKTKGIDLALFRKYTGCHYISYWSPVGKVSLELNSTGTDGEAILKLIPAATLI